ncbi:MAG TPA: acyl-CoA thioesterase [Flavitalea sp.]|nr:acyl-CoA thioesterase [Flavitalea sp.]
MTQSLYLMSQPEFTSPALSETVITELMVPSYTNFGGKIHGGVILSLMDKVAYVCASKHARAYCVTASVDTVDFLESVEVGDLVSLKASINYTGRSSMVVGIRVESENVKSNVVKHTNTSYFTMVAKDERHRSMQVPGLILETEEQIRRFMEAVKRKELKLAMKNETRHIKTSFSLPEAIRLLQNERCIIKEIAL